MRKSFHKACYNGDADEWNRVIDYFAEKGETRMLATINAALVKQTKEQNRWRSDFGVSFRDGSIAKMDAMIAELDPT